MSKRHSHFGFYFLFKWDGSQLYISQRSRQFHHLILSNVVTDGYLWNSLAASGRFCSTHVPKHTLWNALGSQSIDMESSTFNSDSSGCKPLMKFSFLLTCGHLLWKMTSTEKKVLEGKTQMFFLAWWIDQSCPGQPSPDMEGRAPAFRIYHLLLLLIFVFKSTQRSRI